MTSAEYNTLVGQVTRGLPVPLSLNRLSLLLYSTVTAGGPAAERAFRDAVAGYVRRDRGEDGVAHDQQTPPQRRP